MTQKNLASLKAEYDANLADNDTGAISAQDVRDALTNTADSIIPIMASGTDVYFSNRYSTFGTSVDFRPSGDILPNRTIANLTGQWNSNNVSAIKFTSGPTSTTTGGIAFYTAASGNPLPSGNEWPYTLHKRAQFRHDGRFEILGSGVGHIGLHYNRIHHSGIGIFIDHDYGNHLASPQSQTMRFGHYDTASNIFTPNLHLHGSGQVIISREGSYAVKSSGWAELHLENKNNRNSSNNNNMGTGSRILFKGFKDGSRSTSQDIYALGTDIRSSGNSSISKHNFFIQDLYAPQKPHRFYIDPSGNIGIGSVAPSGKLHITAGGLYSGASGVALSLGTVESNTYFDWKLSKPATESGNTYLTLDTRYPAKRNIIAVQSNTTRNSTHVGFGTRTPYGIVDISHGGIGHSGLNLSNTGEGGRRWTLLSTHGKSTALETPANKASGCFVVQDSTASRTRFAIDASGNVGIGEIPQTIKGTATKVLVFGDNGQNALATSLNTAGLFAKDTGGVVKLYAFDEGGNQSAISPHVFKMFDQPDPLAWSYYGINHAVGREINVDVYGAIRAIEDLTGKQFIFTQDIDGE